MQLINLLPLIKRARNYYLYDDKGNRYLDLYLDGGRAICGHRSGGLSLAIKNVLSRGLYAPYPSIYSYRLVKLLKKEFPRFREVGLYKSFSSFQRLYGKEVSFTDPLENKGHSEFVLWRPYVPVDDKCRYIIIRFPFPGSDVIAVLTSGSQILPQSDLLPPYILSGLIRSFFDLKNSIKVQDPLMWSALDKTEHWQRTGPYLVPRCSREEYSGLFKLYLKSNIFISPDYDTPSVCAAGLSDGDLKELLKNIKEN